MAVRYRYWPRSLPNACWTMPGSARRCGNVGSIGLTRTDDETISFRARGHLVAVRRTRGRAANPAILLRPDRALGSAQPAQPAGPAILQPGLRCARPPG